MIHRLLSLVVALCSAGSLWAGPADEVVDLKVLPGWRTASGTHMAALQVTLAPGWKTYWRVPGDGGIPPRFGWAGSQNMTGVTFHWPVPDVFRSSGMRSIGYEGIVIVPVEITVEEMNAPARMVGQVQIGVCEEICVPVVLEFDAVLPAGGTRDGAIVAALSDRPRTAAEVGVGDVTCALAATADGLRVTAAVEVPALGQVEEVVIETGDQQVWVSEPETARQGDTLFAQSDMVHVEGGGIALDRSKVRITIIGEGRAVDIQGCDAG